MNTKHNSMQANAPEERIQELFKNQIKFDVVYADPPWDVNQRGRYGAINHYHLMSLEDIKAMPINTMEFSRPTESKSHRARIEYSQTTCSAVRTLCVWRRAFLRSGVAYSAVQRGRQMEC